MALLFSVSRQVRALHRALRPPSGMYKSMWERNWAEISIGNQRFGSAAAAPVAATKIEEVAPANLKKRPGVDHDTIFHAAERIFGSTLGSDAALSNGPTSETDTDAAPSTASQTEYPSLISEEAAHEFEEIIAAVDKKRRKAPIIQVETLEYWLSRNREHLQPFLNFLARHGADAERTVTSLYKAGFWGRKVMFERRSEGEERVDVHDQTDGATQMNSSIPPYEEVFNEWTEALKREDLPLTAEDMLNRWPRMLSRTPTNLSGTVAVLRAAIPDEADFNSVIEQVPYLVGTAPIALQNRLLKLQLALEGNLQKLIVSCPRLLVGSLDDIFGNLRVLREYSRSGKEFKSFLHTSADTLTRMPRKLEAASRYVIESLEETLPEGVDAKELVKAKPQLLLVKANWLSKRWNALQETSLRHSTWEKEFAGLISDASSLSASEVSIGGLTEVDNTLIDGANDIATITTSTSTRPPTAVPEWTETVEPSELGLHTPENHIFEVPNQKEQRVSREVMNARRAYSALGEALWMDPWRLQRLDYLIEEEPDQVDQVSFIATITVPLNKFKQRFPGFDDWLKRQRAAEHEQRMRAREEQLWNSETIEPEAEPEQPQQ